MAKLSVGKPGSQEEYHEDIRFGQVTQARLSDGIRMVNVNCIAPRTRLPLWPISYLN